MKKRLLIFFLLYFIAHLTFACTSFAVYSDNVYYGMNFDYPNRVLRFNIDENFNPDQPINFYQMGFAENNGYAVTVGMNDQGVFSSLQMLYPAVNEWFEPGENEITLFDVYQYSLFYFTSVSDFEVYLNTAGADTTGVDVLHIQNLSLHSHLADMNGNAMVIEVGDEGNHITHGNDSLSVMTNFPNHLFANMPYNSVSGVGAERYITAYEYISSNYENFNYNDAWEVLIRTAQNSGSYSTQCSQVFDPINNEIYIAIQRDFDHIWKVDLNNLTIETFSGFSEYISLPLEAVGVTSTELQNLTPTSDLSAYIPKEISINHYPNPFNSNDELRNNRITINFTIPEQSETNCEIFNIKGQKIKSIKNDFLKEGLNTITWDAKDKNNKPIDAGIYFIKVSTKNFTKTHKFLVTN